MREENFKVEEEGKKEETRSGSDVACVPIYISEQRAAYFHSFRMNRVPCHPGKQPPERGKGESPTSKLIRKETTHCNATVCEADMIECIIDASELSHIPDTPLPIVAKQRVDCIRPISQVEPGSCVKLVAQTKQLPRVI